MISAFNRHFYEFFEVKFLQDRPI